MGDVAVPDALNSARLTEAGAGTSFPRKDDDHDGARMTHTDLPDASMTSTDAARIEPTTAGFEALATLYNALMTGLVLALVTRHGEALARDFVQAHFRRQHLEKFLPGLRKLGLEREPPAVACALYHYHSNALGGVATEYFRESDQKAWVRYPPPRWIWRGTAVCAIPHAVNVAMLHGWHAHNGVSLGNPRLGFVCTGTITGGQPGLEGYYLEYAHDLAPEERLRFASDERMPRVDRAQQPRLDTADWPEARLRRTHRSYAMEYVRSLVPTLIGLLGRDAACAEIGRAARLIGMQFHAEVSAGMSAALAPQAHGSTDDDTACGFARLLAGLLAAQGERLDLDGSVVTMHGWRLFDGVALSEAEHAAAFTAWNGLWEGLAMAHDRFLQLHVQHSAGATMWRAVDTNGA